MGIRNAWLAGTAAAALLPTARADLVGVFVELSAPAPGESTWTFYARFNNALDRGIGVNGLPDPEGNPIFWRTSSPGGLINHDAFPGQTEGAQGHINDVNSGFNGTGDSWLALGEGIPSFTPGFLGIVSPSPGTTPGLFNPGQQGYSEPGNQFQLLTDGLPYFEESNGVVFYSAPLVFVVNIPGVIVGPDDGSGGGAPNGDGSFYDVPIGQFTTAPGFLMEFSGNVVYIDVSGVAQRGVPFSVTFPVPPAAAGISLWPGWRAASRPKVEGAPAE